MDIFELMIIQAKNGDNWNPKFGKSKNFKNWIAHLDLKTCVACRNNNGKIWAVNEKPEVEPPLHPNCRCKILPMETIKSGTATINGLDGADWYLKFKSKLPDCYVTKSDAEKSGWKEGKWPSNFIPGKLIYDRFYNYNKHLPENNGRIWYEGDINYKTGKRNQQRVLWSNDGLIFVTFDHYDTFFEIV